MASQILVEHASIPRWLSADPLTTLSLWLGFGVILCVLAVFLWRSRHDRRRSRVTGPALAVVAAMLVCLGGEITTRLIDRFSSGVLFLATPADFGDSDLGWRGREVFGSPATTKFKILVLGDSITYGAGVPAGSTSTSSLGG